MTNCTFPRELWTDEILKRVESGATVATLLQLKCALKLAITEDNVDLVHYILESDPQRCNRLLILDAIHSESPKCLEYFHQHGEQLTSDDLLEAVEVGNLDCLRYICEQGILPDENPEYQSVYEVAFAHGHVECFQYLHESGFSLPTNLTEIAIKCVASTDINCPRNRYYQGDEAILACVKYLNSIGYQWDTSLNYSYYWHELM